MRILNFGSCNIDYVYTLDHIVQPGETEPGERLEIFPGGKGLNQSIAIARAGVKVCHAGCLGNDAEMLLDILRDSGVDTSCIKSVNAKNGHAIIQVNAQGENAIFLYPGSNRMITPDFVDTVLKNFESGDLLLLQNEINNIEDIIEKAYEKGMRIVLNPSPINETIGRIDFHKITYLILNEIEGREVSGRTHPEEILSYFRQTYPELRVMLTLGGKGCVYMDRQTTHYQPVFETDVADTTAAGDTFTGYFIAGIAKGERLEKILKTASCASAIAVSRKGAASSIPASGEVCCALQCMKERKVGKSGVLRHKMERYFSENMKTATLDGLAHHLGYSTVYTGSVVKKLFGRPFTKVLQDRRCVAAAEMLADTDIAIKDIIKNVGYENENFFRTVFKEKYGKNLSQYRKEIGEMM